MNAAAMRVATQEGARAIRVLLDANALPTSDLDAARPEFVVAYEGPRLTGRAALQRFDTTALVRTVAVIEDRRGTGLGQSLVRALEQHARTSGLTNLVLLPQTAKTFFERQGYHSIDRAGVANSVQASEESCSLCPQSAACLSKNL